MFVRVWSEGKMGTNVCECLGDLSVDAVWVVEKGRTERGRAVG